MLFSQAKEVIMGRHEGASSESLVHPEWWGGLERDLSRLQALLDFAVGQLRSSLDAMSLNAAVGLAQEAARARFRDDVDRALASLQLYDLASRIIADLRARAEMLETAARSAAPDAMAQAHSRLLSDALRDTDTAPDGNNRPFWQDDN
jgi:hypothetical protein